MSSLVPLHPTSPRQYFADHFNNRATQGTLWKPAMAFAIRLDWSRSRRPSNIDSDRVSRPMPCNDEDVWRPGKHSSSHPS